MATLKSFKDINARNQAVLDRIVNTDYPNSTKFIDLARMSFGYLHVDRYHGKDIKGEAYSWCTCKCGNKLLVRNRQLLKHRVSSCGCKISESVFKRNKENIKHGGTGTRLHDIWTGMCQRCDNPNATQYPNYGGRGIKICDEWRNLEDGFINFRNWALENGYDNTKTVDRIDVDGNYCPENCRWVDNKMQVNNKRDTVYLQIATYRLPLMIWSEITGIPKDTLWGRHARGWTDSETILTPSNGDKTKQYATLEIPLEYEKYNKYEEHVRKGIIKPMI